MPLNRKKLKIVPQEADQLSAHLLNTGFTTAPPRASNREKLKIELRPGAQLSAHFNNRLDSYKVVETDNVLGYIVVSATPRGAALICPLYAAFVHTKVGATWHIVSSYEQGERLNDYTVQSDYQGCTLATIAAQAVAALEERRSVQRSLKQVEVKKRTRRG